MFRIKYCRECVLKILYQVDVLGAEGEAVTDILNNSFRFLRNLSENERQFVLKIVNGVIENRSAIDQVITSNLIGWRLSRLNPVDRNLLRMGIAEAGFNDQKAIVIDDLIRIAKKYSEFDSYRILNAILDKVLE